MNADQGKGGLGLRMHHRHSGFDPKIFYGNKNLSFNDSYSYTTTVLPPQLSRRFTKLFGPSTLWKVFKKQFEVLDFVSSSNCDLLPFTFQINDGSRLFLAAHPITFWYIDEQMPANERHTYEIIQENKPCKLYFDLEFDKQVNPSHDGNKMVASFIKFIYFALRSKFQLHSAPEEILNLDSSTSTKFSCHLIFQNVVFENNYQAGYFVKQLCHEIRSISESPDLNLLKDCSFVEDAKDLIVRNSKGSKKLFCDEGVYTKNRHFRLYKSSKFGKNKPLKLSDYNLLNISAENAASREENIYLCSLITYVIKKAVLKYEPDPSTRLFYVEQICEDSTSVPVTQSPFPEIDQCIRDIIYPGKVYRSYYFAQKRRIVYDIVKNRYCRNIGRQHKSNNVKFVVDVDTLTCYQKCYDPDCAGFKSPKEKLPVDESFFINHNFDDDLILAVEDSELLSRSNSRSVHKEFDDFSMLDDETLMKVAGKCKMDNSQCKSVFIDDNDDESIISAAEKLEESIMRTRENKLPVHENSWAASKMELNSLKASEELKMRREIEENNLMMKVAATCETLTDLDGSKDQKS